jgi:hypothetical protein
MTSKQIGIVGFCFLFSSVLNVATAAEIRFLIASQSNWGKNTGLYLAFESSSEKTPCKIAGLKLAFMVGDASRFYYTYCRKPFTTDHVYSIKAVVGSGSVELWVDGVLCEKVGGRFVPDAAPLKMNLISSEFPGPADHIFVPISMKITSGKKIVHDFVFTSGQREIPNILLVPYTSDACHELEFKPTPGDSLVIETKIKIIKQEKIQKFAPFVDKYFQWRYGDWPGKIKTDDDLKKRAIEEKEILKKWGMPKGFDRFGGSLNAGWKEKPTGFFRLARENGFYWLITPEGNPCFYIGLCGVGTDADLRWPPTPISGREDFFEWLPPKTGEFAEAWMLDAWGAKGNDHVLPITCNIIRKYGPEWRREKSNITFQRMKTWGFSGGGKWARQNPDPITFSWMPVLNGGDTPSLVRHPDVFDPKVREIFEKNLREQCEGYRKNPWLVGLSYGNEDSQMIFAEEIKTIMAMKPAPPAKKAFVDFALGTIYKGNLADLSKAWKIPNPKSVDDVYAAAGQIPDKDLDELRLHYTDRYHGFIYQTIKKHDPNHLYFGSWIPGWRVIWGYTKDWYVMAKHCDVLGYDHYDMDFLRPEFKPLVETAKKPILCGEFGWAPFYKGQRGYAGWHWQIDSDAEVGKLYQKWITDAAQNPYCVGNFLFEHHDESCLGRGPGKGRELQYGEALAWGIIETTDTPKWDMVKAVREINLKAAQLRLDAMKAGQNPVKN